MDIKVIWYHIKELGILYSPLHAPTQITNTGDLLYIVRFIHMDLNLILHTGVSPNGDSD